MTERESPSDDGFVEDIGASLDPNLHYKLTEIASERVAIPAGSDLNWTSPHHFVGRFWVIPPLIGEPEIVSYRLAFFEAEHLEDGTIDLHPFQSFVRCWESLREGSQHLTPHQRLYVDRHSSDDWPRGHVMYEPYRGLWYMLVAEELIGNEQALLAIRRRFSIDPARCHLKATSV
jgi:hypothetical protein